ncbi:single-stranded-DNA-specific exonuclease RecJ [Roseimaritima sediminicola]|uniref:single-stranded-DNA-specific exonuclease RecJ n=1 Tax=Roseimaritima sediminicola TaxID=2662066 RepID=UPI001298412F|nr:single-stranded-DNA-specific exonuclease RecJ [Roseimaritima sediminicola]
MQKRWRLLPQDHSVVQRLVRQARIPDVVAQLLVSRGVYDAETVKKFLHAKLSDLRDPLELPGVEAAVATIAPAIRSKQPIVIYGDYDADGMTSAAILYSGLTLMGADVSYYVPNRLEEGYGLSGEALQKLAERGKRLVITVDCGVGSCEEAKLCRSLGMQLVITDHHRIDGSLPEADAIVHPRLPGSSYPFGELCGAGVAFKLAWALCQEICESKRVTDSLRTYLLQALSLAAIGTVADVVPLVDENRILVTHGLKSLQAQPTLGLSQLMRLTKVDQRSRLQSEDIAFSLAPRLNAAGRLGQAQLGVELLTVRDNNRSVQLAEYLDQLNSNRVSLERSVYLAAQKQAKEEFDPESDPALVLAGTGWHLGVIGVVAGRLAEKYGRPVLILSLDPVSGRPATGSGRAGSRSVDLHRALGECEHRLVKFGGHRAAAGLTLHEAELDAFREDFCEAVANQVADDDAGIEIKVDAEAGLGQLTHQTVRQIEQLAPFGEGNPRPILCARNVRLAEPSRKMGGGDRHLTLRIVQDGITVRGVAFGHGEWCEELNAHEGPMDIVYRPVINEFRGQCNVEFHLVDWRPALTPSPV